MNGAIEIARSRYIVAFIIGGCLAAITARVGVAATTNDPLNPLPSAANEVLYYYDYSNDGTTDAFTINDKSTRGNTLFGTNELIYAEPTGLGFMLPGGRLFDVQATGAGAITNTDDVLGHQDISDYGGFTFETYLKRTGTTTTDTQHIWNPEGMHSLEILPSVNPFDPNAARLQFAIRGLNAFTVPVNTVLPLNEWHHIMAVMTVTQPLPAGGDPAASPLLAKYELFIDGVSVNAGTTGPPNNFPLNPLPPGGSQDLNNPAVTMSTPPLTLELSNNHKHGIGSGEFGAPGSNFLGDLAMTRLSLGALTPQQSLFDFPPANPDFDSDGDVDGSDFLRWQRNNGTNAGATRATGDANGDGKVNVADLAIWRTKFGGPPSVTAEAAVPEPSTVVLCTAAAALTLTRRRRARTVATPTP